MFETVVNPAKRSMTQLLSAVSAVGSISADSANLELPSFRP